MRKGPTEMKNMYEVKFQNKTLAILKSSKKLSHAIVINDYVWGYYQNIDEAKIINDVMNGIIVPLTVVKRDAS